MKSEIPQGWRELVKNEVIGTDDKIWQWNTGPWAYVDGSVIGERYNRPCAVRENHWTIIRKIRREWGAAPVPVTTAFATATNRD